MRLLVCLVLAVAPGCRAADKILGLPATDGYKLAFQGNSRLTERSLAKAIRIELDDWQEADFSHAYADDAAYSLAEHYRLNGYPEAKVDYQITRSDGTPRLEFDVDEGPRVLLGKVTFPGFEQIDGLDHQDLIHFYRAPSSGVAGQGPPVFVESRVRALRSDLLGELRARGFLDATSGELQIDVQTDAKRADVILPLVTKDRFQVDEVRFLGSDQASAELIQAAQDVTHSGQNPRPYSPQLALELRARLLSILGEAGFVDAEVDVAEQIERSPPKVTLTVKLISGPQVRIRQVIVRGREHGDGTFVRSRVSLVPGDLAQASRIRSAVSRLYRSGLFRRVETSLEGEGDTRDLVIDLEEGPSAELFIEPGYGSYELLRVRAGIRERDLWGSGRGVRAEITAALRAQHALVGFSDPEALGPNTSADLTVDYDRREQPSFTSVAAGVGAFLTHRWNSSGRHATTLGYQYRQSDLEDFDIVTGEIEDALNDIQLSGFRISHTKDERDLPLFPRSGSLLQATGEWGDASLGSDLDFIRLTLSVAGYWTWGDSRVVATGLRFGTVRATNGAQTVPIQERFFLGGENSVRSFRESELGPTDSDGNPVGGEGFTLGSIEIRQDLGNQSWQLAGFLDAGHVSSQASDLFDGEGYGWALGLGLRYLLPVGPLRLDLAWNPDASSAEDNLVLHFAVGLAF